MHVHLVRYRTRNQTGAVLGQALGPPAVPSIAGADWSLLALSSMRGCWRQGSFCFAERWQRPRRTPVLSKTWGMSFVSTGTSAGSGKP